MTHPPPGAPAYAADRAARCLVASNSSDRAMATPWAHMATTLTTLPDTALEVPEVTRTGTATAGVPHIQVGPVTLPSPDHAADYLRIRYGLTPDEAHAAVEV